MPRVIPLLAVLTALTLACGGDPDRAPEQGRAGGGSSSKLAPDFTVTTFEGAGFTLSEQRGRPVVLNFWESW
ncbi:MAG: peroxiredoxin family protein [Actinomycetota bacterium]